MANKIGLVGVLIVIKLLLYLGLIGIEIANIEDHWICQCNWISIVGLSMDR